MPKKILMTPVIAQADSVSRHFVQITQWPAVEMGQKHALPEWDICGGAQLHAISSIKFSCIFRVESAIVWVGGFTVCPGDLGPHFLPRAHTFSPSHLLVSLWIRNADKVMHELYHPVKPNYHVVGLGFWGAFSSTNHCKQQARSK